MFGQLAFLNDLRVINKLLLQDEVKSETLACYSEPILKKTYCFTLHWITKELACLYQNRADNKKCHRPSVMQLKCQIVYAHCSNSKKNFSGSFGQSNCSRHFEKIFSVFCGIFLVKSQHFYLCFCGYSCWVLSKLG